MHMYRKGNEMQQRLRPAIDEYLRFRRSEGKKPSTILGDAQALGNLAKHLQKFARNEKDGLYLHNITDAHMSHALLEMAETRKPRSMSVSHSQFNRFFSWAVRTKRIKADDNPMVGRDTPTWHKTQRDRLPVSEFPRLLDACTHPRDRILVAIGLYLMIRVSEIRTIRLSDVMLPIGEIHVRIHKSGIDDFMPISEELEVELRRWITFYQANVPDNVLKSHYYLVPNKFSPVPQKNPGAGRHPRMDPLTGKLQPETQISRRSTLAVRNALEKIGFPIYDADGKLKGEGTHTLRRSGGRAMFDGARASGVDGALTRVKTMLHHASITDTEWYIGANADKIERDEAVKGKPLFPQLKAAMEDPNVLQFPAQSDGWAIEG